MDLSPEQQKQMEEQKAQCIFCQIIDGKVPSKKVYEDDLVLAILDINPAAKGHVLVMPKEHYPIMPIIPPDTFKQLFSKTKEIDGCVKEALLCKETVMFIANGGAAGQQSSHFMLHVIPRDSGDGLDQFDLDGKDPADGDTEEVTAKCGGILQAMLAKNLPMLGFDPGNISGVGGSGMSGGAPGGGLPQKITKEQLMKVIDSNPQVKEAILTQPDQFKQIVPTHPQLSQLFADFDLDEIIEEVKSRNKPREPGKLSLDDSLKG